MRLLKAVAERARTANLPFLLIGGYAVMAHGFVRTTEDLDLLVKAGDRERWRALLQSMGMVVHWEGPNFLQFQPAPGEWLPLDLMVVADETFDKMRAVALLREVGGDPVAVVSLLHLIALKCHAIRHAEGRERNLRILKDTDDLIHLIQRNSLDLNSPELADTILRHGTRELYDKLRRACAPD